MNVLLYQPDIAGNVGTIIRMCACLDLQMHIIEPCGFPFDENKIRRSAMDYYDHIKIYRYDNFKEFREKNPKSRVVLLTTKASIPHYNFEFHRDDFIMVGRESAGVPEDIRNNVDGRVVIPMKNNMRCLNVAISLAFVVSEAMKQCKLF